MKTINVRQYPRSDIAVDHGDDGLCGADAELVRGFITTPLERAIAAADGIDYVQSQSQQGVSTITVRLKLNYDAHKALSDISSRVDAIRRDLPPEAEIPVIAIQAADSQFASAYLEFHIQHSSAQRGYRLPRASGPAEADLGRRCAESGYSWRKNICHAHLDEARAHGGAKYQPK